MGYFPKKVKRARHGRNMNLIANAALAGCTFDSRLLVQGGDYMTGQDGEMYQVRSIHWRATVHDKGKGPWCTSKARAAENYMAWLEREGRL